MQHIKTSHGIAILGICFLFSLFFINWATKQIDLITLNISPASQTASVAEFDSNLVTHYSFDDTTNDSAGSNNGTVVGGATYVDGKIGKAIQFDGNNDYVNTDYVQTSVTAYTIAVWVKTTDAGAQKVFVQDRGATYNSNGQSLTLGIGQTGGGHGGAGKVGFELDSSGIDIGISSTQTINDGAWHYVVGTWAVPSGTAISSSQFKIYIDGTETPITTSDIGSATSPLTGLGGTKIGNHPAWGTFFSGTLDEVRIYNKALSAEEISELYALSNNSVSTQQITTTTTDSDSNRPVPQI